MKSRAQLLKTASNLKTFSTKIKSAQDEVLTPESVKDMAMEIMEVAEIAAEVATEIAEGVPAEESPMMEREERETPDQIEMAQDKEEENKDKKTAGITKGAQDKDDDDDKYEEKEKMAKLEAKLAQMERKAKLAELAPKYASLFPKQMHEAKMNEIINSKQSLPIVEAKIQEASDIITNKTMVKVASMSDSIFSMDSDNSEEVNIAAKI